MSRRRLYMTGAGASVPGGNETSVPGASRSQALGRMQLRCDGARWRASRGVRGRNTVSDFAHSKAPTRQTEQSIDASCALRIPPERRNVGHRRASSPSESTMRPTSPELERLLAADTAAEEERAWREFAAAYSRLILHATRSVAGTHDDSMDA